MRMQSGITDQYIYFVAVDATDYVTRETGLATFTVYRSRNGGVATAYTTPTIAELSAANMPGVYSFLLDEDMTIDTGDDSQEMIFHITHAGMAPVTRTIELYRPIITAGATLTVANGAADADIERIQGTVINTPSVAGILEVDVTHFNGTAGTFASGRPEVNMSHISGSAVSTTTAQIGVNAVQISGDSVAADNAESFFDGTGYAGTNNVIPTVTTATNVTTVNGLAANVITAASMAADASAEIADAVWDEDATGHQTQGSFGQVIGDSGADADSIWALANTNLDATVSSRLASASYAAPLDAAGTRTAIGLASANLDTQLSTIDTVVDSILVDTAEIGAAGAGLTAVPWNASWDAEVQSEVDDALVAQRLDELLNADSDIDGAAPPTVGSVFHELMTKTTGSFTYDQTTDSLEALRDRGDAAWITATGFSTLSAADVSAAVWNAATATYGTAGSYGLLIETNLDAAITTRASQTSLDTVDDFLDTEIAAIKAKTDNLPADPADASDIASSFTTVNSKLDAIDDYVDTEVAAIKAKTDQLTFTTANQLDAQVLSMAAGTVTAAAIATNAIDADAIAADAVTEIQAGLSTLTAAGVRTAVGLASANLDTQLDAIPTAAEINAEVVDALSVDTYAQPGQGTPAATTSMKNMLAYLYKAWRNKTTQTATTYSLYNDDASTVDQKATTSDDGSTFEKTEVESGP